MSCLFQEIHGDHKQHPIWISPEEA